MKKILIIFALMLGASQIFAQTERAINEVGVSVKSDPKKPKANRKGWDGSVKGESIQILSSQDGLIIVFPDNIAFKVNEVEESITETKVKPSDLSRTTGQPIGGVIVKSGKNSGGQMKIIAPNASNTYDLPTDWADGTYKLQVSYKFQTDGIAAAGRKSGSVINADFKISKEGSIFEIVEQSIVNTTKSNTKD